MTRDRGGMGCMWAIGLIATVIVGWLAITTIDHGGVARQTNPHGGEVLTWHGWEPAGKAPPAGGDLAAQEPNHAAEPAQVTHPTARPAPTHAPTIRPAPTVAPVDFAGGWNPAPVGPNRWAKYESAPAPPTAEPAQVTPPNPRAGLGWVAVGLTTTAGLACLGVAVYRHVAVTRAKAAAILAGAPEVLGEDGDDGDPPPPAGGEAEAVDVIEYLEVTHADFAS